MKYGFFPYDWNLRRTLSLCKFFDPFGWYVLCRYTLFWILVLSSKFLFSYFFEVSFLLGLKIQLFFFSVWDVDNLYHADKATDCAD